MLGPFYSLLWRLTWTELGDVLLDVNVTLNNRPLSYIEDDPQFQILTPYSLMFTSSNNLPEMAAHHVRDKDLRKRAKFLKRCKDVVWRRWTKEYVRGLRERHIQMIQYHGEPLSLRWAMWWSSNPTNEIEVNGP